MMEDIHLNENETSVLLTENSVVHCKKPGDYLYIHLHERKDDRLFRMFSEDKVRIRTEYRNNPLFHRAIKIIERLLEDKK